jgi:hypothetical protein
MGKKKKQLITMGILLGVLILAWYMVLFDPLSGQSKGKSLPGGTTGGTAAASQEENIVHPETETRQTLIPTAKEVDELIEQAREYLKAQETSVAQGSTGGTDIQAKEKILSDMSLQLNGILWDEENPMAIINGRVVQETDALGKGISVLQIKPTFVILKINYWENENTVRLSLKPE